MTDTPARSRARRAVTAGVAVGATTAVASGAGSVAAAAWFARRVLTPDRHRPDDVVVRAVRSSTVVLGITPETVVPGRYGLWFDNGFGHARVGDVVRLDPASGTVERELLGVDRGHLARGGARWNPYYYGAPPDASLDLPTEHVTYAGDLGPMPAWVVTPPEGPGERWAVLVHGRGARREETIRVMPPLLGRGWTCLVPSYRNDEGVPAGPDGRYALGLSEWRDVEAAIRHAVDHGAREVLLMGWSMGGAIVLQLLDRSPLSALVSRVVLDGPVIDWGDVLAHHAKAHRVPAHVGSLARVMMRQRWGPPARGGARGCRPGQDRLGAAGRRAAPPGAAHPQRRRRVRALRPVARAGRGAARPGHLRGVAASPGTARSGTPTPSAGSAWSVTSPATDGVGHRGRVCHSRSG